LDGVIHYAVDHTPAIFAKSATEALSTALYPFIDCLVEERPNPVLERAVSIRNGVILDPRIIRFQNREPQKESCLLSIQSMA
jgi:N5-(carboxyethyl)ornithine synthase